MSNFLLHYAVTNLESLIYMLISVTHCLENYSRKFKNVAILAPCCSVTQSYLTLCDPMDCSTPGSPTLHHLMELVWTHVHWVSDAIQLSSSVVPFSSCLQSFPGSGSFPMSQFFASGGQNIGASASVLSMNIQGLLPLGLTGLISLQSKGLSRVFSSTTVRKHQFCGTQPLLWSNSHPYMTNGKP